MATPTTDLELVNIALAKLSHTVDVVTLATDNTPEAKAARKFIDVDRERALAAFGARDGGTGWRFASKRAVLVNLPSETDERWTYFYTPPADMVAGTGWIWAGIPDPPPDTLAEFAVIPNGAGTTKMIACNLPPVTSTSPVFVYTKLVTNVALYPQPFVDFFTWLLAADLAMPVTKEPKLRDWAAQWTKFSLSAAVAAEMRGSKAYPQARTPSYRARG